MNKLYGSYQILNINKQGQLNYKGLNRPYGNKRQKVAKGKQALNSIKNSEVIIARKTTLRDNRTVILN